ncbi:MAG: ribosome biogenesis GTPase Der [Candidatus Nanopelagicales bacterium]|nr:ribosome biogenesis GTPase Der [Candidatus Nanopelagicales bacterium]
MSEQMPGDEVYTDDLGDDTDLDALAQAAASVAEQEFVGGDYEPDEFEWMPVVAVIGRPNVGKSTLVNRILGRREAVVQDVPGVTRDRVRYVAEWSGKQFQLVDTGGWEADATGMRADIAAQAQRAVDEADVVLFVVDAIVGATDADEDVVPILRASGKPVVLTANKVDDAATEADASALWSLGLGEPYPVSGLHGRGSGDLLDEIIARLPEEGSAQVAAEGPRRVAIVGRPNVGKSSLLNRLAGHERAVVDSVAGTTVDPVDEVVTLGDEQWLFVDTAGIRRRVREASGHEYYASLRTQRAIERAEVALVVIDASQPISEQDIRIIQMVVDAGRAMVIAFSKWDLMDDERRRELGREMDLDLIGVPWAQTVNISGKTGRGVERIAKHLRTALDSWQTRVPTGRLNKFLTELVAAHPHPVRGGRQPRILFGTQASVAPPTFALFTTGFLESGYRRFVERRLREEFGFVGTPMRINLRIREKRRRR